MPAIRIPTSFNIDVEFQLPEFYRRLLAVLIDLLVLFFYNSIANLIVSGISESYTTWDIHTDYDLWGISMLFIIPIFVYHPVSEILMSGQSVGKKMMGLRIVNENGGRPSISQYIIRWLLRDIWFFLLFLIGIALLQSRSSFTEAIVTILFVFAYFITEIILVISSAKGQRIGDMLAKTILIRTHFKANIEETVFQEVEDNYVPVFPQIMQLSDKDINSVKSILETAKRKGDFQLAAFAADRIRNHLQIQTDMSPFDFLEIVLKDYNYLSTK